MKKVDPARYIGKRKAAKLEIKTLGPPPPLEPIIQSGKPEAVDKKHTRKSTRVHDTSRDRSSDNSREKLRGKIRDLPTRDEVQEFSFRLRDELKVKVQAEVPHRWQKDLEKISRDLNVKKLELYRFIFGEFLGKVKRKKPT